MIGFLSSFVFVSTALASGIAPTDVIALANNSRAKEGLSPLSENPKLSTAAKHKAEDMLKNDYFAHTSPAGVTPWFWVQQVGYQYKAAGENLAINFTSALEQHSAWMKSTTHRANILNAQYQEIGVAVVKGKIDGKESVVTVEMFGTPLYGAVDRTAAIPPVVQQAPAAVKGTEIQTEVPLSDVPVAQPVLENTQSTPNISPVLPTENFAQQMTPAVLIPSDVQLFLSWAKTRAQTIENTLREQLGGVQWSDAAQTTAVVFLMLASLLGPIAFLHKAALILIQTLSMRAKGADKAALSDLIVVSQSPFSRLHQSMKRDTRLIHDIRAG